jgi:hypothetical protein
MFSFYDKQIKSNPETAHGVLKSNISGTDFLIKIFTGQS